MPNNYVEKVAKDSGMTLQKVESYWNKAEEIAKKSLKPDVEGFYGYVTGIFKKMVGKSENVNEDQLIDITEAYYDYVCEEGEIPTTQATDIAQPDKMLFGKPLFRVSKDMFMKIGCGQRDKGWYQKFYGTKVGEWARANKGKDFCIQDEETDYIFDVPRDKHKKNEKEINLDGEK